MAARKPGKVGKRVAPQAAPARRQYHHGGEMEKMTLAEALDVAHDVLGEQSGEVLGRDAYYSQELAQAAAVLREFRERGLPFFGAAKEAEVAYAPMLDNPVASTQRAYGNACDERRAAYRRLTTEGE